MTAAALVEPSLGVAQWVQAVGSVIAIVLAVWLARSSRQRRVRHELMEEVAFVRFVHQEVEAALAADQRTEDKLQAIYLDYVHDAEGFPWRDVDDIIREYRKQVTTVLNAIDRLSIDVWPNPELYVAFKHGFWRVRKCLESLDEVAAAPAPPDIFARYHRAMRMGEIVQEIDNDRREDLRGFLWTCGEYIAWSERPTVTLPARAIARFGLGKR